MPPSDTLMDIRAEMALTMERIGIKVECHHHEVATAGQCEIDMSSIRWSRWPTSWIKYKYVVKNVAHRHGKTDAHAQAPVRRQRLGHACTSRCGTATSRSSAIPPPTAACPRPGVATCRRPAGSTPRRYCVRRADHQLLPPSGAGLRGAGQLGLVDPQPLGGGAHPDVFGQPKAKRAEFRCPDPSCNPYIAFAAMLMAGLDGIRNRIDPGDPVDKNIYDLPPEELAEIPTVPGSLAAALAALEADHEFLTEGDVFTEDFIENYLAYKRDKEVDPIRLRPHPYEFVLYYDI